MLPVAVILCGCGRADGSEIHESVSILVHLDRCGLKYQCFAPDGPQTEVVDHLIGQPVRETRNMLVEAARIARGEIKPLSQLNPSAFAALAFPGGFGAAKNLCTFAKEGAACTVIPDVARVVLEFHQQNKPIALACIAPVIAAKVLGTAAGGPGCAVTLGAESDASRAANAMDASHIAKAVTEAHVDETRRIITTPAYMCDTGPHGVFVGIGKMIDALAVMVR
ncbi:MAG: isoprenoid biosynthesis glyoxalase ElbB [Phycisphaerales bacterium]|nr:isoprenoid biosynthesis glyoxalase ElbB [Phycisphaerales bacterium]